MKNVTKEITIKETNRKKEKKKSIIAQSPLKHVNGIAGISTLTNNYLQSLTSAAVIFYGVQ